MKLRWSLFFVVLPAVVALFLATAMGNGSIAVSQDELPSPSEDPLGLTCEDARKFLDAGMRARAFELYETILEATPGLDCAIEGQIAALAAQTAIAQTPTPSPTPTPTATPTQTPDFRPIENMVARGEDDQAATAIAGIFANDPYATAPASLSHLDDNPYNDLSFGVPFVDIEWSRDWDWTKLPGWGLLDRIVDSTGFPSWDMVDQIMDGTEDFLTSWGWLPTILIIFLGYLLLNAWHNRQVLKWRYLRTLWWRPVTLFGLLFRNPIRVTIGAFDWPAAEQEIGDEPKEAAGASTSPAEEPASTVDTTTEAQTTSGTQATRTAEAGLGTWLPAIIPRTWKWMVGVVTKFFGSDGPSTAIPESSSSEPNQPPPEEPKPGGTTTLTPAMASRIHEHYDRIRKASNVAGPKLLLTAPAEASASVTVIGLATGALKLAGPLSTVLTAVISGLRVEQNWELRGRLVDATTRDIAVEVQLVARNSIVNSEKISVLEAGSLPPEFAAGSLPSSQQIQQAYISVSEDIAIWLYDQLTLERRIPGWISPSRHLPHLLWENWESYASFRQGVEGSRAGNRADADKHFNRSLSRDPHFLPARINRLSVQAELIATFHPLPDEARAEKFRELANEWQRLADELDRVSIGFWKKLKLRARQRHLREWYVIQFNLAAARHYATLRPFPTRDAKAPDRLPTHRQLLGDGKDGAQKLLLNVSVAEPSIRQAFFTPAFLLNRTLQLQLQINGKDQMGSETRLAKGSDAQKLAELLRRTERALDREHIRNHDDFGYNYAMACLYAMACMGNVSQEDSKRWANVALDHLERTMVLARAPRAVAWAKNDPSLASLRDSRYECVKTRFETILKQFEKQESDPAPDKQPCKQRRLLPTLQRRPGGRQAAKATPVG